MANTPKTVPDAPPALPVNVPTSPDTPPARPFNVPVSSDTRPVRPFQVGVSPDVPPVAPFNVPTAPDAAPAASFQVPVTNDAPPAAPVNVPTSPDLGPGAPYDVPTSNDPGPALAADVPTVTDPGPASPNDVTTQLDAPPATPSDVSTSPDDPPAPVLNVPTTLDAPPVVPFQVGTTPDVPSLLSTANPAHDLQPPVPPVPDPPAFLVTGERQDWQRIINAVKDYDNQLAGFLTSIGLGGFDVSTSYAEARLADQALVDAVSTLPDVLVTYPVHDVYSPSNTSRDSQDFTVDAMVDASIPNPPGGYTGPGGGGKFLTKGADGINRFDASLYFESRSKLGILDTGSGGAMLVKASTKAFAASGVINVGNSRLAKSAATDGVIRVSVPGERPQDNGSVLGPTQDPSDFIDDDDARVPLSFTDLRQVPGQQFRSVYFRPLNLTFSNSISPEYSSGQAFGRVDPVVGYSNTSRKFSVSFSMYAFAVEDLEVMWQKMVWLQSMCYPTYGGDGLIRSGPVVRMRIGDAVATKSGGVPGVIQSLNFDFAEATWELKRGMKVPRSFNVSLDFLALHDGPVGTFNGTFGVWQLPQLQSAPGTAAGPNQNFAATTRTITAADGQTGTLIPGQFAKFGEPRS